MKTIVLFGAGRSASALIEYLSRQPVKLFIVEIDQSLVQRYEQKYDNVSGRSVDLMNITERETLIEEADLVISMLPARFHIHVAKSCLNVGRNLLTASYVDADVEELSNEISEKGLLFLYECGLDPGIDHMSAMKLIDEIQQKGGEVYSFFSNTGGLMAPGSDDNPWRYKFTWNPRNVVLAGKGGTAQYMFNGVYKNIPHHQLFKRLTHKEIPGYGDFETYPNRDSLKYKSLYGLDKLETILRGTFRRPGYCSAWNAFVQLGMTDDSYNVPHVKDMTYADFTRTYLPYSTEPLEENFARYLGFKIDSEEMEKIRWLGIFEDKPIGLEKGTPAQIMQHLLEQKWKAEPEDEDMIVMQHEIRYSLNGKKYEAVSSMATTGKLNELTGMAKTVGYPLGIAAMAILNGEIDIEGLHIPVDKQIYEPVLNTLAEMGIKFEEKVTEIKG